MREIHDDPTPPAFPDLLTPLQPSSVHPKFHPRPSISQLLHMIRRVGVLGITRLFRIVRRSQHLMCRVMMGDEDGEGE